jgi:hypothetical protein
MVNDLLSVLGGMSAMWSGIAMCAVIALYLVYRRHQAKRYTNL